MEKGHYFKEEKMKRLIIFFLILFIIPMGLLHSQETNNNNYKDNIIKFGGNSEYTGTFEKDIVIIGGKISLKGKIKGDIIGIWSTVEIKDNSTVNGDIVLISSKLKKANSVKIRGAITKLGSVKEIKKFAKLNISKSSSEMTFSLLLSFFFWYVFILVVYALIPDQIESIANNIKEKIGKSFGFGILFYLIIIFLILIFAILSLFLIGIPFLILMALLILILKGIGRASMSFIFGYSFSKSIKLENLPSALILAMGLIIITLIKSIPFLGGLLLIILDSISFGAIFLYKCKKC